jgi:TRAP-type C4-dicarboxylate transport system permease small subunit
MQTFKEHSKEMDYSNLYYPFSEKGPIKMRRIENILITIISLLIIFFGINIWISSIPTTNTNVTQNTVSITEGSMEFSAVIDRVVEFFKSFNFDGNAILLPILKY